MSGHSKWSTIKHKKGAADAKRGAIFTKLAKGLTVAAQNGGADPDMNFSLRLAVDRARAANMPKDNIDRAIQRGVGGDKATALDDVTYEGYGPGGVAIIVEATTDNRNRTAGQVRAVFSKHGCSLGESGTVAWQFKRRGTISVPAAGIDADELTMAAIDAGAVDVEADEDYVTVYTEMADFQRVKQALEGAGYDAGEAELAMVPDMLTELEPAKQLQVLKFIEVLEDQDDVDQVWTNARIDDEVAEQYGLS
jgi:YebC/PmpR family DNA-binding regulatory protein